MQYVIAYDMQHLLGSGGYGHVYRGGYKGSPAAVKVVFKRNVNEREERVMKELDHENVAKLLHAEDREDIRCYALELCDASLDQLYLDEGNPKKYGGPMPSDADVIVQLAMGLEYIHSKGLVHRDVKPANVLIQRRKSVVLLKWADFGLSKPTTERGTYSQSGAKGTLDWMAPEVLELMENEGETSDSNPRGTVKSDVFATGCLFFWLLTKGLHPFGKLGAISLPPNILQKKVVNIIKLDGHIFRDIIISMIQHEPNERIESKGVVEMVLSLRPISNTDASVIKSSTHQEGWKILMQNVTRPRIRPPAQKPKPKRQAAKHEISYDRHQPLGGRSVFLGVWEEMLVAVKVVPSSEGYYQDNDVDLLVDESKKLRHRNLVRIYHVEDQLNMRCLAMEKCHTSLENYFRPFHRDFKINKYSGSVPEIQDLLKQLANGLSYLHKEGCVHGHIKPSNVLFNLSSSGGGTIKWTGFMHGKPIAIPANFEVFETEEFFWLPAEVMKNLDSSDAQDLAFTIESDVFSAGCLFHWFITQGQHPFGEDFNAGIGIKLFPTGEHIPKNIMQNRRCNWAEKLGLDFPPLGQMISKRPTRRPTMPQIVEWLRSDPPVPNSLMSIILG